MKEVPEMLPDLSVACLMQTNYPGPIFPAQFRRKSPASTLKQVNHKNLYPFGALRHCNQSKASAVTCRRENQIQYLKNPHSGEPVFEELVCVLLPACWHQ